MPVPGVATFWCGEIRVLVGQAVSPAIRHWTRASAPPTPPNLHKPGLLQCRLGSVDPIRVAKVVVPGLVLPKWLPCSTKDPIGVPRRRSFQPSHQHCQRNAGKNQQMHVVRHNRPGQEFIEVSLGVPGHNRAGNQICNAGIGEPCRPWALSIQSTVLRHESMSGSGTRSGSHPNRQCSPQAPGQEQVSMIRMVMGQSSAVFSHSGGWQAKPPAPPRQVPLTTQNLTEM